MQPSRKNKSCQKQSFFCTAPAQCNEKNVMKLSSVSAMIFKTLKELPQVFWRESTMEL